MNAICGAVLATAMLIMSASPAAQLPDKQFYDQTVEIYLLEQGEVLSMNLHDYLIHVVLQEMPASFEEEALKAQTVAARTFTMQRLYGGSIHEDADVCGESSCCQCYMDETEAREAYGDGYEEARDKVQTAVESTDGQVLLYEEALIEAAYFSSTGGSTETAADVWGGDIPYLQSVSSPEAMQQTSTAVSFDDVRNVLPEADLSGTPAAWFGTVTYTEGGAVGTMEIGGISYSGTTLRSRFGLRSARFTVAVTDTEVVFEVTGSGHGVGMSQYGANTMAESGGTYREILLHYYTGTKLQELY